MSFSFSGAGYAEDVTAQLDAYIAGLKRYPNTDTSETEAVVAFVKAQITGPAYAGGVLVDANGHRDQWFGSLQLTIRPLSMPPKPEPQAAAEADPEPVAEPAAEPAVDVAGPAETPTA